MSTEHLNNDPNSLSIDPERENDILDFVESLSANSPMQKAHSQGKWMAGLRRRISRRTLTLIVTSTITVLLAVSTILVMLVLEPVPPVRNAIVTPDNSETTTTTQVNLLDKTQQNDANKKAHLLQVDIQNNDDTYTIRYDEATKAYVIKGYEDIHLSNQMMLTLRHYTETIQAYEKINSVSDLADYGLSEPQATASISYADGTSTQLFIGNKTPSGNGYYGQIEKDDGVYIFDAETVALFHCPSTAFVDVTLITTPEVKKDDETGQALLKNITFSGTAHPQPLVMRRSNHTDSEDLAYFSYIIEKPYLRCTSDAVSSALSSLQTLSADQALFIHPTDEQKTKLGFDNPLIQIDATMAVETEDQTASVDDEESRPKIYYNSANYKITIGSLDKNGNYIAMMEGIDVIFLIKKDSYDFLLGRTYQNSVNEYLFFKHIASLDRISVEYKGEKHDFKLTHHPEKEELDNQLTVTSNGKVYSTGEFRELYELIMALERHSTPKEETSENVVLTLSLYDVDGSLYLSADYYETTATLCTVKTSQGEVLTTLWSDVAFFIDQVDNYLAGENVLIKN